MPKNVLFLRLTQLNGNYQGAWSKPVPQQTLTLRAYRIEFDTAAHALACKFLRFSTYWLGGNATQSGIDYGPTADATYTFYNTKGVTVNIADQVVTDHADSQTNYDMSTDAPLSFDYSIYGIATTGFVELTLTFEYDIGVI